MSYRSAYTVRHIGAHRRVELLVDPRNIVGAYYKCVWAALDKVFEGLCLKGWGWVGYLQTVRKVVHMDKSFLLLQRPLS
jgi:hypothetical protein